MKKNKISLFRLSLLAFLLFLISGCATQSTPVSVNPTPSQTLSPSETPEPARDSNGGAAIEIPGLEIVSTLVDSAPTRTPQPTATPDAITQNIIQLIQRSGLSGKTVLWLSYANWINLGISLLYVLVGYLVGTWMIRWLLPRLVSRTKTKLDDLLLQVSGNELRWLLVVLILRSAVDRLIFIQSGLKRFVSDVTFVLALFLVSWILWRLINLAAQQAEARARKMGRKGQAESLIMLGVLILRLGVIIMVIPLLLTHFGINITGFAFVIGLIIFVVSLAGRDILTDIVAGAMILIDRPFRIGDRLELPSINSWGDVVEIGMRSTKILSVENRMVVIPNSLVGKNEIINYSYPDPSYFDTVNVLVGYDNDVAQVEQILAEAILSVEGVQKEREIYTLLIEFTDNHMLFWACWWVASYRDRYPVHGKVSKAIIQKLKEAGISMPYRSGYMNVKVNPDSDSSPKAGES